MPSATDAQLFERVQRGEYDCFETLVERYQQPLRSVAYGKLGDRSVAEDVVQETFLAVFAARHTFNSEFSFRTWLWTILLNRCRKQYRKSKRKPEQIVRTSLDDDLGRPVPEPATYETGLSRVLQMERSEQLELHLNELSESQADALRLRFYGGLKFSEIADAMQSSVSGAKRRVRNGLLALAHCIEKHDLLSGAPSRGTNPSIG